MRDTSMVGRRRSGTDTGKGSLRLPVAGRDEWWPCWKLAVAAGGHTATGCGSRAIDSRAGYPKCRKQSPEQRKVMTAVQLWSCTVSRQGGLEASSSVACRTKQKGVDGRWARRLAGRGGDRRGVWTWTWRDAQAGIRIQARAGASITFQKQ